MQRREFIKKASVGAFAGAAGAVAAPAIAQSLPTIKWRMTSSFPKTLETIYGAGERLANRVRAITNGKFDIRVFPAGEIVPPLQGLDAVQQRTVECAHTLSPYYIGKNKAFGFLMLPFGMNTRQLSAWVYEGGGQALLDDFYADYGVRSFLGGGTGTQMGGWFRKEVNTVADLQGLKMRISGLAGEISSVLGVVPQQIPAGDTYAALEKGTIDAVEWIGPHDDEKLGFDRIAKNYYFPAWWEPGPSASFFVNNDEWAKLPKAYQEAFEIAAFEAHNMSTAGYDAKNPFALARLMQKGVKLRPFSDEILNAAYKAARALYENEAAKNPAFKKIFVEYDKFHRMENAWFSVAEGSMDRFMRNHR